MIARTSRHRISIVVVTLLVMVITWTAPLVARIDIGQWDQTVVHAFYDSEYGAGTTFRWSMPQSVLVVPAIGAGTYDLQLNASALADTQLDITVHGRTQHVMVHPGFARYTVPIETPFTLGEPLSVTLSVAQPHVHARRVLGVALDEVRFVPQGWHLPPFDGISVSAAAILVLTLLLRVSRLAWHWRWLAASGMVVAVIVLRHGNAATLLSLVALCGSLALACAYAVWMPRHHRVAVIGAVLAGGLGLLWWRGVAGIHPVWQLTLLLGSVPLLRLRRLWWRACRPYRHVLFGVVLLGMASQTWLLAGLSLLLAVMYVIGKKSATRAGVIPAVLFAGYSLFPLIDAWLRGYGMPRRASPTLARNVGLDYLRGLIIFMVMLTHMPTMVVYLPPTLFAALPWVGEIAVDGFFILSGWLIGELIINDINNWHTTRALGLFLHRRWARTIPIYWLTLVVVIMGGWSGASLAGMHEYFVFVQNMWHNHPPYLLIAWSLSIEEWFYVLTALGISLLVRVMAPARALLVTLIFLLIIPALLRNYVALTTTASWHEVVRQYIPFRLDMIGSGVAMVWWWRTWRTTTPHWATRIVVAGTTMTVLYLGLVAWYQPDIERDAWVRLTVIPMTCIALVAWLPWLARVTRPQLTRIERLIQWMAWVSYPLYLIHYPWRLTIEGIAGDIGRDPVLDAVVTVVYLVGAVWIAGRWHIELEQPVMQLRLRH